ncbi:HAD family hydrolase [Flavonifractor sp. An306]|uniref:acylneuraminate cytidylyltransferase family protein n=1 Tax=Flavonifractor sp. An306 TaxID=1965629 RepID=UPI000B36E53B|nr:HAD family hydrolase [Flavonifractor sp. An306]OUO38219.1 HAD family hydrolase [Flavonifractor sp. An306]
MKVVAFVTIKLNSQRLANKNILPLGKHPLCWHICNTLLNCKTIDEIYIYCSEERVMDYVPHDERLRFRKRETWLDGDLIRAQDTYSAFINEVDADIYVAALTTAPFIRAESIDSGVEKILLEGYDSAFAAQALRTFAWYGGKPLNYLPEKIPRTQDIEPVVIETSGFFAFKKQVWIGHKRRIGFKPYIQFVDDLEAVDIDTKEDYLFAQKLFELKGE